MRPLPLQATQAAGIGHITPYDWVRDGQGPREIKRGRDRSQTADERIAGGIALGQAGVRSTVLDPDPLLRPAPRAVELVAARDTGDAIVVVHV